MLTGKNGVSHQLIPRIALKRDGLTHIITSPNHHTIVKGFRIRTLLKFIGWKRQAYWYMKHGGRKCMIHFWTSKKKAEPTKSASVVTPQRNEFASIKWLVWAPSTNFNQVLHVNHLHGINWLLYTNKALGFDSKQMQSKLWQWQMLSFLSSQISIMEVWTMGKQTSDQCSLQTVKAPIHTSQHLAPELRWFPCVSPFFCLFT